MIRLTDCHKQMACKSLRCRPAQLQLNGDSKMWALFSSAHFPGYFQSRTQQESRSDQVKWEGEQEKKKKCTELKVIEMFARGYFLLQHIRKCIRLILLFENEFYFLFIFSSHSQFAISLKRITIKWKKETDNCKCLYMYCMASCTNSILINICIWPQTHTHTHDFSLFPNWTFASNI